jgi:hypothetical protein
MKTTSALIGGLAGSIALTILHQVLRTTNSNAPHMDELGMEAISKSLNKAGLPVPEEKNLYLLTMAGDIAGNAIYYAAAGIGDKSNAIRNGVALGLAAGVGGVLLPKPMGLNEKASTRTTETKMLTVAIYLFGGIVASAVMSVLENRE